MTDMYSLFCWIEDQDRLFAIKRLVLTTGTLYIIIMATLFKTCVKWKAIFIAMVSILWKDHFYSFLGF